MYNLSAVRTFSDVLRQSLVVRAVVSCQNSVVWQLSAVRTVCSVAVVSCQNSVVWQLSAVRTV